MFAPWQSLGGIRCMRRLREAVSRRMGIVQFDSCGSDQGAELIRSMNDTALRMQADYITNAERSDNKTKNAMRIAVLSLLVSAVGLIASSWFSYQTYADGKAAAEESRSQAAAFENRHKDLMTAQHEDRLLLIKAIAELKQPAQAGKK